MQSILEQLPGPGVWEDFLAYRLRKGRLNWHEFEQADAYVADADYLPVAERFAHGGAPGIPVRHQINKMGTGRKRIVYSFPPDEMTVLKVIAHLLYRYDGRISPNCYSFRRGLTAHDAVMRLVRSVGEEPVWAYKLDIHDYFNSISIPLLLPILQQVLADDPPLYRFFETMLSDDRVWWDGGVIHEQHGVMAGTPTAPFLADIYLTEVDRHFEQADVLYARYSDDMILFARDRQSLDRHIATLASFLEKYRLQANPDKERIFAPGEAWDFLGFKCLGRSIDIADATRRKMQDKIRRKAHALLRWRRKQDVAPEAAMRAMIRHFNTKFFEGDDPGSLTWSRWFFPLLTETDGLRRIDRYFQEQLRFLATGRHNKKNFSVRYGTLKSLGYRSLVHEFYAPLSGRPGFGGLPEL